MKWAFSQVEKGLGRAEAQELRHKEHCVSMVAGVEAGKALEAGGDKALSSSSLWSCFPTTAPIFPVFPLSAGYTAGLEPLYLDVLPMLTHSLPFITTNSQGFSDLSYLAAPARPPNMCLYIAHSRQAQISSPKVCVCLSPVQWPRDGRHGYPPQLTPTKQHCTVCTVLSETGLI